MSRNTCEGFKNGTVYKLLGIHCSFFDCTTFHKYQYRLLQQTAHLGMHI